MAISGSNIFAGTDEGVFLSTNDGGNWSAVNTGLIYNFTNYSGPPAVNSLAISGNNIFAGTEEGIYFSNDNGTKWTTANNGLTCPCVSSLTICGSNIFAGSAFGVFISSNNGNDWMVVNTGLTNIDVNALAVYGSNIFAGTNDGIFLSTNNGGNWLQVNTGLPANTIIYSLVINDSTIFAGTNGNSVWQQSLANITTALKETPPLLISDFMLYPNPANSVINVQLANPVQNGNLEVYNTAGQIVYHTEVTDKLMSIPTRNLIDGIYAIRLTMDMNAVGTRCFVVTH